MTIGVYLIFHRESRRFYIGSSKHCERRFREHRKHLRAGTHHSPALQNLWNKYGEDAFDFEVFRHSDTHDDALDQEQQMLSLMYGDRACLNGSSRARMPILSLESRERCRAAMLSSERYRESHRRVCLERNADPEFQARARAASNASPKALEARRKNVQRLQDQAIVARNREALRNSKAQKAAAYARATANWADPEIRSRMLKAMSRAVIGTHIETGERVEFPSQSAAARFVGVYSSNISMACRGLLQSIKGYRWELVMK
ncbi:MAG: GIY-YIG nuclease family protein [Tagaea sp.]